MVGTRTTKTPEIGSDDWKTFVADAMGRSPSRRTVAEKTAIVQAKAGFEAIRSGVVEGSQEWLRIVNEAGDASGAERTNSRPALEGVSGRYAVSADGWRMFDEPWRDVVEGGEAILTWHMGPLDPRQIKLPLLLTAGVLQNSISALRELGLSDQSTVMAYGPGHVGAMAIGAMVDHFGWLYHGTSRSSLTGIAADGLLLDDGPRRDLAGFDGGSMADRSKGKVHLCVDHETAVGYANGVEQLGLGEGVVVRIALVDVDGLRKNPMGLPSDRYVETAIPASSIQVCVDGEWVHLTPDLVDKVDNVLDDPEIDPPRQVTPASVATPSP